MSASGEMSVALALVGVALLAVGFWLILKKPDNSEGSNFWWEIVGGIFLLITGGLFVLQVFFVFLR